MRILILGVSGMLGNVMYRELARSPLYEVFGMARSHDTQDFFVGGRSGNIVTGVDVEKSDSLISLFAQVRPHVVVNCIGLVKQLSGAYDPLLVVPINTLLPHRLASLCLACGARLVHFSTDCVFTGSKGNYTESDIPDAIDLYGRTKLLGEVVYPHTLTIRTSMIGPQIQHSYSLLGWFLNQSGSVKGYTRAIFSGLPTIELAHIVREIILPRTDLQGVYHVGAQPISKYDLLCLIAEVYKKKINIITDDSLVIDRSLDSSCFFSATGYQAPSWHDLISKMHQFQ